MLCALHLLCAQHGAAAAFAASPASAAPSLQSPQMRADLLALLAQRQAQESPFFSVDVLTVLTCAVVPLVIDSLAGTGETTEYGWLGRALSDVDGGEIAQPPRIFVARTWPLADRQWPRLVAGGTLLDAEVCSLIDAAQFYLCARLEPC